MADAVEVNRLLTEDYYPEEPLTKANGLQADLPEMTEAIILQGHSLVAVDSENGRVVGAALNDEPPQAFPNIYTSTSEDIKEMFSYMEETSGVLDAAPQAIEVRMLVVASDWRKLGVATALLSETRTAARLADYRYLKLYCTSAFSSRLMNKLGWRLLYSLPYQRYVCHNPCGMVLPPAPHFSCDLFIDEVDRDEH